ncbi:hypothetical protein ROZALSC1DRAFT_26878, partial [Rozella allomycis CSF55]
ELAIETVFQKSDMLKTGKLLNSREIVPLFDVLISQDKLDVAKDIFKQIQTHSDKFCINREIIKRYMLILANSGETEEFNRMLELLKERNQLTAYDMHLHIKVLKPKKLTELQNIIQDYSNYGVTPNAVTMNLLIEQCHEDYEKAEYFLQSFYSRGILPNNATAIKMLECYDHAKQPERALNFVEYKARQYLIKICPKIVGCLFKILLKMKDFESLQRLSVQFYEQDHSLMDDVNFEHLLKSLVYQKRHKKVLEIWNDILRRRFPTPSCFRIIMVSYYQRHSKFPFNLIMENEPCVTIRFMNFLLHRCTPTQTPELISYLASFKKLHVFSKRIDVKAWVALVSRIQNVGLSKFNPYDLSKVMSKAPKDLFGFHCKNLFDDLEFLSSQIIESGLGRVYKGITRPCPENITKNLGVPNHKNSLNGINIDEIILKSFEHDRGGLAKSLSIEVDQDLLEKLLAAAINLKNPTTHHAIHERLQELKINK